MRCGAKVETFRIVAAEVRERVGSSDHRLYLEHALDRGGVAVGGSKLREDGGLDVGFERNLANRQPISLPDAYSDCRRGRRSGRWQRRARGRGGTARERASHEESRETHHHLHTCFIGATPVYT